MVQLGLLKRAVIRRLAMLLNPHGLRLRAGVFRREVGPVGQEIALHPIMHPMIDFELQVFALLQFRDVQRLAEENPDTNTLALEVGGRPEGYQKSWRVAGNGDVEPVSLAIYNEVVRSALPFFEKYSEMAFAVDLLSGDRGAEYFPMHDARMRRVAVMYGLLAKESEGRSYISRQPEEMRPDLETLLTKALAVCSTPS